MPSVSVVQRVCRAMERIAPLRLAEKWDNVGLLLESPNTRPEQTKVMLTIDLTPPVLACALASHPPPAVIVSYHPPLFRPPVPLALTLSPPTPVPVQALLRCAAAGISVFSPHTALDSAWGALTDWLIGGIVVEGGGEVTVLGEEKEGGGIGRVAKLGKQLEIMQIVKRVKSHLKLDLVQLACPYDPPAGLIRSVAAVAGSGGDILLGSDADVYLTGEMSYHDILAAKAAGKYVILCGHDNTERGYLPHLAEALRSELRLTDEGLEPLKVTVSAEDRHPLIYV